MKGIDKTYFILILLISIPIGYLILPKCYEQFSDLITFLSILIGFQITAISILFNSRIVNVLYDNKNKSYITELHRLKAYFKYAINYELISVVLLLTFPKEFPLSIFNHQIMFYKSYFVLPIILGSIFCFLKISNEFFRIFILPRNEK